MLEPAQYVVMRLPYFGVFRKGLQGARFIRGIIGVTIFLGILFAYGVGYFDAFNTQKVPIFVVKSTQGMSSVEGGQGVVASKSGTTFYYPWCSGRNRIKPENERWFEGPDEALKYGLKPAKNCLGL